MNKPKAGSTQSRVFDAIKHNGQVTIIGMQQLLNLAGAKGYAHISNACRDLMRAGYITRPQRGTYAFVREPGEMDYSQSQQRMVRVIRIRTKRHAPFTARTLSELVGCSHDWAKRYIVYLCKNGWLERTGSERIGKAKAPTYLAVEDRLNEEWPSLKRQSRTVDIDKAVSEIKKLAYRIANEITAQPKNIETAKILAKSLDVQIDKLSDLINDNFCTQFEKKE